MDTKEALAKIDNLRFCLNQARPFVNMMQAADEAFNALVDLNEPQIQELVTKRNVLLSEISKHSTTIDAQKNSIAGLKQSVSDLTKQHDQRINELEKDYAARKSALDGELAARREQYDREHASRIAETNEIAAKLRASIADLTNELEALTGQKSSAVEALQKVKKQFQEAQKLVEAGTS